MPRNENINELHGLVVISAKERGKLLILKNGVLSFLDEVNEHPPSYSDNEGFFMRSGNGQRYGSGSPREEDDEQNLLRYFKAIREELSNAIETTRPDVVYLFEPEHLKGKIIEELKNPHNIPIEVVAYGNYVDSPIEEIEAMLKNRGESEHDPSDPASVKDGENADEKRKILETGEMRDATGL